MSDLVINGKTYPLWSQFVEGKAEWIGGKLQDFGDSLDRRFGFAPEGGATTEIVDVALAPCGEDAAMFEVIGKDFSCAFNVQYGGISQGEPGWITFHGYGGHKWRIQKAKEAA